MAVVEPPPVQQSVLEKIESFVTDPAYLEMLESSASYNSRLSSERRIRMPFVDTHTGVAQTHSDLFKNARQRLPGLALGQLYTYPSKRWCKRRRQYLMGPTNNRRPDRDDDNSNTGDNPLVNEDSKDSTGLKDEVSKEQWYYEDEMMEMDGYDDPDMDSDYDYDDHYRSGRKKKRTGKAPTRSRGSSRASATSSPKGEPETPASGGRGGRGRKRALLYDMDNDKPFACELCSARYKTRPGLTYHYTHTHKETKECDIVPTPDSVRDDSATAAERRSPKSNSNSGAAGASAAVAGPLPPQQQQSSLPPNAGVAKELAAQGAAHFQDSYLSFLTVPGGNSRRSRGNPSVAGPGGAQGGPPPPPQAVPPLPLSHVKDIKDDKPTSPATNPNKLALPDTPEMDPYKNLALSDDKARVAASPYCDFCLGDSAENRKTAIPEELVSCSDCGRSGHPSCLQFTPNMIRSVRKYRWQCIECKCCSICGTSDNDDQLLFCDDCDRGYHMYCLAPPLTTPPEGSWSCGLCLVEFHRRGK